MERLTIECGGQWVPKGLCSIGADGVADDCDTCGEYCDTCGGYCDNDEHENCAIQECFNRLAAYEDTGLTPEEIWEIDRLYAERCRELAEYKKAEEQGLILQLPCRTMDRVIKELEDRICQTEKVIVKNPHDKLDQIANDTAEAFIEAYKDAIEIVKGGETDEQNKNRLV